MPSSERATIANNTKIVIKPADKDGFIVIQDTTNYIAEAVSQ